MPLLNRFGKDFRTARKEFGWIGLLALLVVAVVLLLAKGWIVSLVAH
jgi:hypothetical protein